MTALENKSSDGSIQDAVSFVDKGQDDLGGQQDQALRTGGPAFM